MDFGKYVIVRSKKYHFELEPELYWEIKPPTSGDELEMTQLFNRGRVTVGFEGTTREAPPTPYEIAYLEIALTFASTNIMTEDGEPILEPDAPVHEIQAMLRQMPHAMVMEIWRAIGEMVVGWGAKAEEPEEDAEEAPEEGTENDPNLESQETS